MKTAITKNQGFTRTDLAVVIVSVGLLAVLFGQAQDPSEKAKHARIYCISNLKQIGLALRMWSNDNKERFPMQVEAKAGGSLEAIASGETFRHFTALSNYMPNPKVLICPSDDRMGVTNWSKITNTNLGYFVALDADETKPQMLLSGDRNLTNGLPTQKGVLEVALAHAAHPAGWTDAIHSDAGNIGLADGSAQQVNTPMLRKQIMAHQEWLNVTQGPAAKPASQRLQFPE